MNTFPCIFGVDAFYDVVYDVDDVFYDVFLQGCSRCHVVSEGNDTGTKDGNVVYHTCVVMPLQVAWLVAIAMQLVAMGL